VPCGVRSAEGGLPAGVSLCAGRGLSDDNGGGLPVDGGGVPADDVRDLPAPGRAGLGDDDLPAGEVLRGGGNDNLCAGRGLSGAGSDDDLCPDGDLCPDDDVGLLADGGLLDGSVGGLSDGSVGGLRGAGGGGMPADRGMPGAVPRGLPDGSGGDDKLHDVVRADLCGWLPVDSAGDELHDDAAAPVAGL
jgi:hypothetical protein